MADGESRTKQEIAAEPLFETATATRAETEMEPAGVCVTSSASSRINIGEKLLHLPVTKRLLPCGRG